MQPYTSLQPINKSLHLQQAMFSIRIADHMSSRTKRTKELPLKKMIPWGLGFSRGRFPRSPMLNILSSSDLTLVPCSSV